MIHHKNHVELIRRLYILILMYATLGNMTIFLPVIDIYMAYVFLLKYHPLDEILESYTIRYILG